MQQKREQRNLEHRVISELLRQADALKEENRALRAPVLVVGAGAAGLVAALAAAAQGVPVHVLDVVDPCSASEKEQSNTARSTGLIPAAGTRLQRALGIVDDTPELLRAEIFARHTSKVADMILNSL